jgi:phage recombination protein Bet
MPNNKPRTHRESPPFSSSPKKPMSQEQLDLIRNTVARGASNDELKLFLIIANRAGLDPFTRQIHFVKRGGAGTVQTGIDGYRAIAERSGQLAGIDDAIYDTEEEAHPNKASVTIYRMVDGQQVAFTASARWDEYVPPPGQDFMWKRMPYFMLGKVAEALALRKAFPNDLSGLYIHEEMQHDGKTAETSDAEQDWRGETDTVADESTYATPRKEPSIQQRQVIERLMKQKKYSEDDLRREGFPALSELSGGSQGTASQVISWLLQAPIKQNA